jgi:cholesterol transport system auxiliary component
MTDGRVVDFAGRAPQKKDEAESSQRGLPRERTGGVGRVNSFRGHLLKGVVFALLLPGCAALGGRPEPLDTYELAAPVPEDAGARVARTQILVAEPTALKQLDGQEIVVKTAPGSIEVLQGAQWGDRLPRIVQAKLAESFQLSGRFGGVGKPGEGLAIDYQVVTEIRAFEIRVGGGDHAYVELFVKLLNDRNGVVRASRVFSASVPVAGEGNDAFIAALDQAFGTAASEIIPWTVAEI